VRVARRGYQFAMDVGNSQCSQVQALRNAIAGELNHGNEIHKTSVKIFETKAFSIDLHQLNCTWLRF
jgi:hypothetical protein